MTNFLIRHFIKNYEMTDNQQVRSAYGILAGVVGIICNLLLFAVKIGMGLLVHSMAVVADAFNNLSDAMSSIISIAAVRLAEKPSDEDHPFGHGRMEYVAALIVSVIVIYVGAEFFRSSLSKIRNPEPLQMSTLALVLLILSVAVKLWLAFFNRVLGRRINSKVLKATSADALFDAVTTSVTVLALLAYAVWNVNIDGVAGLIVSIVVIYAGIGIARDTLNPLIGEPMDPELSKKIEQVVSKYPNVVGVHDLVIHNYGPNRYMASVHIEVPRTMGLEDAHEIANRSEQEVLLELGVNLVVHVDPVETEDPKVLKIRSRVERTMQILDPELSMHDFHVAFKENVTLIIFDMAVPYSYTDEQESRMVQQITALMKEWDKTYDCKITVDRGQSI